MDFGFAPIMGIVVVCYLLAEALKAAGFDKKWLPVFCGALGAILGVFGMFIIPGYPANDYITAAAIGIVSGFTATGVHQVGKQLGKDV